MSKARLQWRLRVKTKQNKMNKKPEGTAHPNLLQVPCYTKELCWSSLAHRGPGPQLRCHSDSESWFYLPLVTKYNVHPNHASLKHRKVAPLSACPGINTWGNLNVLIMSLLFLFIVNGKWKVGRTTGQRRGGGRHYWCLQGSILEHKSGKKRSRWS